MTLLLVLLEVKTPDLMNAAAMYTCTETLVLVSLYAAIFPGKSHTNVLSPEFAACKYCMSICMLFESL